MLCYNKLQTLYQTVYLIFCLATKSEQPGSNQVEAYEREEQQC